MSVVAREFLPEDAALDLSLRPQTLDDFVGQKRMKEQLSVGLDAAKGRGEALDHVLLAGPPGLGKTSLAYIIRNELGVGIRTVAGPAIERKGDMAAILTSLEKHDVLFVDEIHRLNRAVEEILYPALEDFRLDIIVGQGPAARTLTLDLPPFTLVGATTRTGLLTTPLRDRFGMTFRLAYYEREELATIVRRSARILGVQTADAAADEIARRARGTPRVANRILRRVRDVAEVRHQGAVTIEIAREALELHEVDELGLERVDRELLRAIVERFGGGPVGLSTLAVALGEETDTIEDVYEPYLLQLGFIQRTPRGRVVTELDGSISASSATKKRSSRRGSSPVPFFRRRDETLNEKLLREAGYSTEGVPIEAAGSAEPAESDGDELVFTLDAPELAGTSHEIVTLPDASVLVDEDAPDVSDVAEAVEQDLDPPYRATAVRQSDGYWLVTARPIQVELLSLAGEEIELSSAEGATSYTVDGQAADTSRIPAKLTARGEREGDDYVVRARRLDGDFWEIEAEPL